jgi:hypothetical protein
VFLEIVTTHPPHTALYHNTLLLKNNTTYHYLNASCAFTSLLAVFPLAQMDSKNPCIVSITAGSWSFLFHIPRCKNTHRSREKTNEWLYPGGSNPIVPYVFIATDVKVASPGHRFGLAKGTHTQRHFQGNFCVPKWVLETSNNLR